METEVFGAEGESKELVDNWLTKYLKNREELKGTLAGKLKTIVEKMKEAGMHSACASFDGCGDSGAVESVIFSDKDGVALEKPEQDLTSLVDQLAHDYLDANDLDWYNNDGGYGELTIDASRGTASLNVSLRRTETDDYSFELDEKEGEENDAPAISQPEVG